MVSDTRNTCASIFPLLGVFSPSMLSVHHQLLACSVTYTELKSDLEKFIYAPSAFDREFRKQKTAGKTQCWDLEVGI